MGGSSGDAARRVNLDDAGLESLYLYVNSAGWTVLQVRRDGPARSPAGGGRRGGGDQPRRVQFAPLNIKDSSDPSQRRANEMGHSFVSAQVGMTPFISRGLGTHRINHYTNPARRD